MASVTHLQTASPVFVVGYMRSGTTLLFKILCRHSAFFGAGGETCFFDVLPVIRNEYPDLNRQASLQEYVEFVVDVIQNGYRVGRRSLRTSGENESTQLVVEAAVEKAARLQNKTHELIFRLVFDGLARTAGRQRWLEKTPQHVYHIPTILRTIPNAYFVEIVRDPRDVLASKKTQRATVWTDRYRPEDRPRQHLGTAYDPFWDTLAWKSAIRAGTTTATTIPDRILRIRYEDLVTDPTSTVRGVCDFLSLPFEEAMLDVNFRNAAAWKDAPRRGIFADSVGRWQQVLTPAEVAICQFLARRELINLGYTPADVNRVTTVIIAAGLVARSGFEFFQRLFRKLRLGGFDFFIAVVGNYWRRFKCLLEGSASTRSMRGSR